MKNVIYSNVYSFKSILVWILYELIYSVVCKYQNMYLHGLRNETK